MGVDGMRPRPGWKVFWITVLPVWLLAAFELWVVLR